MSADKFIEKEILAELFRHGRFKTKPTLNVVSIEVHSGATVEASIADQRGLILGVCWQRDLKDLLDLAEAENDTALSNPNIHVVSSAIKKMSEMRTIAAQQDREAREARLVTTGRVLPFGKPGI